MTLAHWLAPGGVFADVREATRGMTAREHTLITTIVGCVSTILIVAILAGAVCFVSATAALATAAMAAGTAVAGFGCGILASLTAYLVIWLSQGREPIVPLRRYQFSDGLRVVVTRVGALSVTYVGVQPDGSVTPEHTTSRGAFRRSAVSYELVDPGRPSLVVHGGGR